MSVVQPILVVLALAAGRAGTDGAGLLGQVTLRARVTAITPDEPVRILWRRGGEGLGGEVVRGELTALRPLAPREPGVSERTGTSSLAPEARGRTDVIVERGPATDVLWLKSGAWSPAVPLSAFQAGGRHLVFLTFTVEGMKSRRESAAVLRNLAMEFELGHGGKVLKRFSEIGPDGPTAGIVLPLDQLGGGPEPAAGFVEAVESVSSYAQRRAKMLQSLPWADAPVPKRFALLTDCGGYRPGSGYGIRTTNREALLAEFRSLRQLGVNGFRNAPEFVLEMIRAGDAVGRQFARIRDSGGLGYPVPRVGRSGQAGPAAGCPYHPAMANFRQEVQAEAATLMDETVRKLPVEEYWLITVDEIGSVFELAPEGKDHQGSCPHCRKAFHEYLKGFGLAPADFDAKNWDDLRSTYGYWAKGRDGDDADKAVVDKADEEASRTAKKKRREKPAPGAPAGPPPRENRGRQAPMSERGWALLHYYSRRFNTDSSAMLFAPQREFFERENQKKQKALAAGRLDAPEARQPWVYCYALRGNTFLMGGHSLDFFDFYRKADNGFMYETSNRDPRVWQWDSYLCDVGRILSEKLGKRFGIYVKPHRGAPIQRALSAAARQAKVIYWYTYGPDWVKGDSFSERPWALAAVSRVVRLLAAAEDVIYEARRPVAAEIAVVRPRTSEFFETAASWENGKWVYAALSHAHLTADPLDEELLLTEDLSRYKIIYVSGSHLRRDVAAKLADWVRAGGTLYTSGGGLARDEANQPLEGLKPVLGLRSRPEIELWNDVARYGATALAPLRPIEDVPAKAAAVMGSGPFAGGFQLAVGREALDPAPETEVLARFGDGRPAATRHACGKGAAYVIGFYPGLEYSADILKDDYNLARDFRPAKRAFVAAPAAAAGALPVVDASVPLVDGTLLRNAQSGKTAIVLANWAYRARAEGDATTPLEPAGKYALVPFESVSLVVRGVGPVREVRSAVGGAKLAFRQRQNDVEITLPRIEEGDVLLLE